MADPPLTGMGPNLKPLCQGFQMHPRLLSWKRLMPSCWGGGEQRGSQAWPQALSVTTGGQGAGTGPWVFSQALECPVLP